MIEITNYQTEGGRTKVLPPEKKQTESEDKTSSETENKTKEETKKWQKKNL